MIYKYIIASNPSQWSINKIKKEMEKAARDLDFMEAARLRDEMFKMQKELEGMKK